MRKWLTIVVVLALGAITGVGIATAGDGGEGSAPAPVDPFACAADETPVKSEWYAAGVPISTMEQAAEAMVDLLGEDATLEALKADAEIVGRDGREVVVRLDEVAHMELTAVSTRDGWFVTQVLECESAAGAA